MLKTNVITKTYRFTLLTPSGGICTQTVIAESEAAAKIKITLPEGWEITEVGEL